MATKDPLWTAGELALESLFASGGLLLGGDPILVYLCTCLAVTDVAVETLPAWTANQPKPVFAPAEEEKEEE